jgi:hypothetical protein
MKSISNNVTQAQKREENGLSTALHYLLPCFSTLLQFLNTLAADVNDVSFAILLYILLPTPFGELQMTRARAKVRFVVDENRFAGCKLKVQPLGWQFFLVQKLRRIYITNPE